MKADAATAEIAVASGEAEAGAASIVHARAMAVTASRSVAEVPAATEATDRRLVIAHRSEAPAVATIVQMAGIGDRLFATNGHPPRRLKPRTSLKRSIPLWLSRSWIQRPASPR
jgi:hypothetical protein